MTNSKKNKNIKSSKSKVPNYLQNLAAANVTQNVVIGEVLSFLSYSRVSEAQCCPNRDPEKLVKICV